MIIRANTLSSSKAIRNVFFDNITYYSENRTKDTKSKLWKLKPQNKTNKFTFKFDAINCKKLYIIRNYATGTYNFAWFIGQKTVYIKSTKSALRARIHVHGLKLQFARRRKKIKLSECPWTLVGPVPDPLAFLDP